LKVLFEMRTVTPMKCLVYANTPITLMDAHQLGSEVRIIDVNADEIMDISSENTIAVYGSLFFGASGRPHASESGIIDIDKSAKNLESLIAKDKSGEINVAFWIVDYTTHLPISGVQAIVFLSPPIDWGVVTMARMCISASSKIAAFCFGQSRRVMLLSGGLR
jgi:hypothetical protein